MADSVISQVELVHLARLGLAGKRTDFERYLRRLTRRLRSSDPQTAERLDLLLAEAPTAAAPFRGAAMAHIPVDLESRLQLLRVEHPVQLEVEPIWTAELERNVDLVLAERQREGELRRAGLAPTRSMLFVGPPGVGKTLTARFLAQRLLWPLLTLDLSAVISSFLGRTGNNLRNVLDYAKSIPCVLLLDELDAVAKRRDDTAEIGELKRLVTVLLQEIDDWPESSILVAATNHPELLDPAVWRRFDIVLEFPSPSEHQVVTAVRELLSDEPDMARWVDVLAHALRGMSFSDIRREVTRARRAAVVSGAPFVDQLRQLVRHRLDSLSREERGSVAIALVRAGVSQRQVSELTGVSRDTIRKAFKGLNADEGK